MILEESDVGRGACNCLVRELSGDEFAEVVARIGVENELVGLVGFVGVLINHPCKVDFPSTRWVGSARLVVCINERDHRLQSSIDILCHEFQFLPDTMKRIGLHEPLG